MKKTVRPVFALVLILVIVITSFSSGCNPFKRSGTSGSGLFTNTTICENVDPQTYQPLDNTAVFPVDFDTIYCTVKLNKAPTNTEVKAQWLDNSNKLLLEKVVKTQGTRYIAFSLQRADDNPFTSGKYSVKLFANGKLQTTASFVVGSADVYFAKNKGADNHVIDGSGDGGESQVTLGAEAPVVTLQQVAPNNFDLPAEEMEKTATPGEETVIAKDGMKLVIPAGAVSGDTRVVVKEFTESPPLTTPEEAAGLPEAVGISRVYDFGPDGTKFRAPVQITIPYDAAVLPPEVDEKNISLAYFDGKNWVAIGGQVDTARHTVSIQTAGFPGMPIVPLIIVAKVVGYTGALAYVLNLADEKKVPEKLKGYLMAQDLWGNAYTYVNPDDRIVKEYTKKAMVGNVPLQDPQNPNQLNPKALEFIQTQVNQGVKPDFGFNEDGKILGNKYYDPPGRLYHMWLTPADYFINGMKGNCIDSANAYCSIFRALGLPAKCVDGYLKAGGRHEWVEVLIGNRIYYIDNGDEFMTLEDAEKTWIIRPYGKLKENYQWDEKGQVKYVPYWWTKEPGYKAPWDVPVLAAHVDNPLIKPETLTILTVTVTPAQVTRITVDGQETDSTDNAGYLSINYTIPDNTKAGPYKIVVRAPDLELSKVIDVTVAGIQVSVRTKQVQPTWNVTADVTIYPKGETPLQVTVFGQNYSKTTNSNGSATLIIPVPEQAKPVPHKLIVRAATLGVTAEDSFTVVAAQLTLSITPSTSTGEPNKDYKFTAVTTNPPGEPIYEWSVDGKSKSVDDKNWTYLKFDTPGRHEIMVTLVDNRAGSTVGRASAGIEITTIKGSLNICSVPSGADIYITINGQNLVYQTPYKFTNNLEAGDYHLILKKTGYLNHPAKVTIGAGQLTDVCPNLVAIESTPETPTQNPVEDIGATRQRIVYCSGSSGPIAHKHNEIKLADRGWVLNGIQTGYHCSPSNGVAYTDTYINGDRTGPKRDYDTNGKLTYASEYVNGVLVKLSTYNTNYNCVSEICTRVGGAMKCTYPKCP